MGVAEDGRQDTGEFVGFLKQGAQGDFDGIIRGCCLKEAEPQHALTGLLLGDPDAENEVSFGYRVVGFNIIGGDRSR